MKKAFSIIVLSFVLIQVYGQCNCETINRNDGVQVTTCPPLPVAGDNNYGVGVNLLTNGQEKFVAITVRFRGEAQNISGNLSLRLKNNQLISFELVNAQKSYLGGETVAQAIFYIPASELSKIRASGLKTVSFQLIDGLLRTLEVQTNSKVLVNQSDCI